MSTETDNTKSEVLESWEEIDEVQLDSTVERLKEETMKSRIEEERLAAAAVTTIQKPVMILRRPQSSTTNGGTDNGAGANKPKTQIKSLMQRQQEYAEARMRILGSMPDEEDVTLNGINGSSSTNKTRTSDGDGMLLRR
ncbi:SUZ domain-containing protein 1 [Culicoides brevitarsis]|uniref:SUZ domain-containing protein 1 n=1 Tax=Culicoides brevitarsis TaxID=469753 RepID=UPI00307B6872